MEYQISKETAALVDAVKAVRNIHGMVYDALLKTYDDENVINRELQYKYNNPMNKMKVR